MKADRTCIRDDVHVLDIDAHVRALRHLSMRGLLGVEVVEWLSA
jgi:UDP-glucose 4-epimerase